jgi:hypothetical protein
MGLLGLDGGGDGGMRNPETFAAGRFLLFCGTRFARPVGGPYTLG